MRRTSKAATAGSTKRLGKSKPALLACVLAACVAALTLVVGSASGATTRFLVEAFGSAAQPTFPADRGMAFDQGASHLYVIDSTNDTISRFNADGTAASFAALGSNVIDGVGAGDETPLGHLAFEANRQREQLAIDESGGATDGNVYATRSASDVVDVFASSGEYLGTLSESSEGGPFGEPCGVAVDSSGTVYVGDRGDDRIHVYEPAGAVPTNADNTASLATVTDPCTLAAGSGATAGFLFVNASTGAQLRKVDAASGEVKYEIATGASTVSVDPATGHVFAARNTGGSSSVEEYDASGATEAALVSSFKPGNTVEGIALNSGAEQVYVARAGTEEVEVFGPAAVIPDVVTSPPSSNTGVRATLAGTVNPDGVELDECFFEWGKGSSSDPYTDVAPCAETPAEIGAGTTPVAVHADINGLIPQGTQYHYRLVAVNPSGTVSGASQNLTTPDTVNIGAATGVTATEATLNGTVNPDEAPLSECVFEYGLPKEPGEAIQKYPNTAPCVPGPGGISGTTPVAVHADLEGLHPGAGYIYRLKAAYPTGSILSDDEVVQTSGPVIVGAWSESVVRTEATLKAEIDPEAKATTYRFEYGITEAYGSETPELAVGSDSLVHEVSRFLTGLQPSTTYHYRVIATNADAVNVGPDLTFTTYGFFEPDSDCPNQASRFGASANLPDCRAYEMVSPVNKNGGEIRAGGGTVNLLVRAALNRAASDGEKMTYSSVTAFGDVLSSRNSNQYMATRGTDGWSTHAINAPLGRGVVAESNELYDLTEQFKLFTPDLSKSWVTDHNAVPLTTDAITGLPNLYERNNLVESYRALTSDPTLFPAFGSLVEFYLVVQGHSRDYGHIVFAAGKTFGEERRQLFDFSNGEMHLVSVLPNGEPAPNSANVGYPGNLLNDKHGGLYQNAVSADGTRVFWSIDSGTTVGGLFVRENPDQPQSDLNAGDECTEPAKACTRQLAGQQAYFVTANTDGSKILYIDDAGKLGGLTKEHIQNGTDDGVVYELDVDTGATSQIAGESSGVLAASDDLSYVYFASKEVLAPGGVAGEQNVYLRHGGTVSHVATVARHDVGEFRGNFSAIRFGYSLNDANPLFRAVRLSGDGSTLAFQSVRSLTGYDNRTADGEPAVEVYVYDADSDELSCASCNPSGARPQAEVMRKPYRAALDEVTEDEGLTWAAAWLQTEVDMLNTSRALSTDGTRLYFNAFDALVPRDTNGAQDVYQWTAGGTHGCEEPDGCVALISSGDHPLKSEFVDATPDGSSVFIETDSSFDPRDPGLTDIYVARVNGGYPPPPAQPPCVGDACQSVPAAPRDPTPSSASFRGAGDPRPRRSCASFGKRAGKLSRRAKRLRRAAKRSPTRARQKRLRRRSVRMARQAKRLSKGATRCRRANRRANR